MVLPEDWYDGEDVWFGKDGKIFVGNGKPMTPDMWRTVHRHYMFQSVGSLEICLLAETCEILHRQLQEEKGKNNVS